MEYVRAATSVRMKEYGNKSIAPVWMYHAEVKNKKTGKIIFQSGINRRRDDACYEVAQFLRNHPEIINEYVN